MLRINRQTNNQLLHMDRFEDIQMVNHHASNKISFLNLVFQQLELNLQSFQSAHHKSDRDALSQQQNFKSIFFRENTSIVNQTYIENFALILGVKLYRQTIKKKTGEKQTQLSGIEEQYTLQDFKQISQQNINVTLIRTKFKCFFQEYKMQKSFAQQMLEVKEGKYQFYNLLLGIYYYYFKEIFIEKYEFDQINNIYDKILKIKTIYGLFFLDYCKELRYLSRKQPLFQIVADEITTMQLINKISDKSINSKVRICLSHILRGIIQNGYQCSVQDLINIADSNIQKEIKESIYEGIIYFQSKDEKAKQFIDSAIQSDENIENNHYLIQKRIIYDIKRRQKEGSKKQFRCLPQKNANSFKNMENYSYRNKLKAKHIQSLQNLELSKQLKREISRQQENNKEKESVIVHPEIFLKNDIPGNDRSLFNGTFQQIKNLFYIAQSKGLLKKQDKDEYLYEKFLKKSKKNFCKGVLGQLLVDRMIGKIYSIISKKQKITFDVITYLINIGINTTSVFRNQYLRLGEHNDEGQLQRRIQKNIKQAKINQYQLIQSDEQKALQKFMIQLNNKNLNKDLKILAINQELELIKVDMIITIYHALIADQKKGELFEKVKDILFKALEKYFKDILSGKDEKKHIDSMFFEVIIKICTLKMAKYFQQKQPNWKNMLFNVCIFELSFSKSKKICLQYIKEQVEKIGQHNYLFKNKQIQKIVNCICQQKDRYYSKILIKIVLAYLVNKALRPIDFDYFIKIKDKNDFQPIKIQYYTAYYLNTERQGFLTQNMVNWLKDKKIASALVGQFQQYNKSDEQEEQHLRYIILIILYNLSNKICIKLVDSFSSMLLDHKTYYLLNYELIFAERGQDQENNQLISETVAYIIYNCLRQDTKLSSKFINNIFEELKQGNLRTRIILSRVLRKYSQTQDLTAYLANLQEHLAQQIFQIRYNTINTYLNASKRQLKQDPQSFKTSDLHLILIDQQIYLDGQQISANINDQLLKILKQYIERQKFVEFAEKKTFNIIIFFLRKELKYVQQCIYILVRYSKKYWIPRNVLQALDGFFLRKPFEDLIMQKLQSEKQKIYQNLIKNEEQITIYQINLWIDKLLNCDKLKEGISYFEKLNKISKNQDLPHQIFNTIQLQRCCKKLSEDNQNIRIQQKIVNLTQSGLQLNDCLHFSKMKDSLSSSSTNVIKILYFLSLNQQIPMSTIEKLLAIYQPHNKENFQNQKFIASIVVNTYLNYQINEILSKDKIFVGSVDNQQLLEITLPIIIKQDFSQSGQKINKTLIKLMQFYKQTKETRHRELICPLFTKQYIIQKLMKSRQISLFEILTLQYQTQKISDHSKQGLKIYARLGSKQARDHINFKSFSQNNIKQQKIIMESQELKFSKFNQHQTNIKQHKNQTTFISKKIDQILQWSRKPMKNEGQINQNIQEKQEEKKEQRKLKADYLYSLKELKVILLEFSKLFKKHKNDEFQVSNKIQMAYLQVIIMISSIHQSHVYEQILTNNQQFVSLVEKKLNKNQITLQLLQVYSKVIKFEKCKNSQQIFAKIIQFLSVNNPPEISLALLILLHNFIIVYEQNIIRELKQQTKINLKSILSKNITSQSKQVKFISIKCIKLLLQPDQPEIVNINKQVTNKYTNKNFDDKTLKEYIQIFAALDLENYFIQNDRLVQQKICSCLLKFLFCQISNDELQRIHLLSLWQENEKRFQSVKQKIETLLFLSLNVNNNYENIQSFIKYLLFDSNFHALQILKNLNSQQFQEKTLCKSYVHHHLQYVEKAFKISPEIILHITYDEELQYIVKFFNALKILDKKDGHIVIKEIYENQTSLKILFENIQILNLYNMQAFNLLNQINSNVNALADSSIMKQIILSNLKVYSFDLMSKMISLLQNKFKEFKKQLQYAFLLEFFQLITHFKNYQKQILQSLRNAFDKCKQQVHLLFQKLNQIYVKKAPIRNYFTAHQSINKISVFPQQSQKIYKQKGRQYQEQLTFIRNNTFQNKLFSNIKLPRQIKHWSQKDFKIWARQTKKLSQYTKSPSFIKEALMIIQAAIYGGSGNTNKFRDNQLISCLIMLNEQRNNINKLLQISTGEGKSTIICAVAIILALKGHQVDVITTTSILAQRDVKAFQPIYNKFLIKISDNIDREPYLQGTKKCYKNNVVYGQISQFQFDYLRDIYNGFNTLGGRLKSYVIVDQVDSMLIDDSSKIAKISSNIAGMDKLQIIYVLIWQRLLKIKQNILEFEDKSYYFDGRIQIEENIVKFYFFGFNKEEEPIKDVKKYMETTLNTGEKLNSKIVPIQNSTKTIKQLLMKVKEQIQADKIHIPVNLKDFVNRQFPKWVESAIQAYEYQENIHYIVENESPSPVDYDNTGKVQHSTHWANGLHQFLQLKHFLKITPQNLTTNFISNIKYFKLYPNIVGVTGTLGSQKCKKTLSQTYFANIITIPDSFLKQLVDYPLVLAENTQEWISKIKLSVQYQLNKNRGILIICETIQYCNYLSYYLSDTKSSKIKLYTMNDKDQERYINEIQNKQIIIATNLAGRGTDIKAGKLQEYGGLHVIITFLPNNLRVQDQAKGRTARNGSQGSCQIIINKMQLPLEYQDKDNIFEVRDKLQQQKLDKFILQQRPQIQRKDIMFAHFCQFLKEMKSYLNKKYNSHIISNNRLSVQIQISRINKSNSSIIQNTVLAIQQRWAFYLNKSKEQQQSLQEFKQNLKVDSKIIKNPYYYTLIGYDLLNSKFHFKNIISYLTNQDIFKAKRYLLKAIEQDTKIPAAWIGMGEFVLKIQRHQQISQLCEKVFKRKDKTYKQLAIHYYQQGAQLLKKELKILTIIQQYSAIDQSNKKSLFQQTFNKYQILMEYLKNVMNIILQIKKSKKLVTIAVQTNEKVVSYRQIERKEVIIKEIVLRQQNKEALIRFHHLNSNLSDQSKEIFDKLQVIASKQKIEADFIILEIKDVNQEQINSYLLNSKIKKKLSHRQALKIVQKQKSDLLTKFIIKSRLQNKVIQSNRNESIQYLNANQCINDTYDLTISSNGQSCIDFTKGLKLTITSNNLTQVNLKPLISYIQCPIYQLSISKDKNYPFRNLLQFIEKNRLQQKINFHKIIWDQFIKLQSSKCMIDSTVKCKFSQQNYESNEVNKIVFERLSKNDVFAILSQFSDQFFTISFINCTKVKLFKNAEKVRFNLVFHSFQQRQKVKQVQQLLNIIKDKNKELVFDLIIKHLNQQQMIKLCQIDLSTEDIWVRGKKEIHELFPKANAPYHQIYNYMLQGIQYILIAQQKKSMPLTTVFVLGTISTVQMFAGILLMSSGFGAIWGISLVMESLVDFTTTFMVAKTGQFNTAVYVTTKAISLALILFFGLNGLGIVGASLLSVAKANGIKITSQTIMSHKKISDFIKKHTTQIKNEQLANNKKGDFQFRKIIQQTVLKAVTDYFIQKDSTRSILSKMLMLDHIQQSKLWQRKLERTIKSIVYSQSEGMELTIQKFAKKISQKMSLGQEISDFERMIKLRNNKYLRQIIASKCQQFQIKIHDNQSNMLKLNQIFKKYSNSNEEDAAKIYEALKKSNQFANVFRTDVDGKQREFKYQTLNLITIQLGLKEIPKNDLLQKCKIYKQNQNYQNSLLNIYKLISQQISSLLVNKLLEEIANPLLKNNSAYSSKNIRDSLGIERIQPHYQQKEIYLSNILQKGTEIQQDLLTSNNNLQINIGKYAQLVRRKPATPIDILMLLEEYNIKAKLINSLNYDASKFVNKQSVVLFQNLNDGSYRYTLLPNHEHKSQKLQIDEGFYQIKILKNNKISIYMIRRQYSKIIMKKPHKFLSILKSFYSIHPFNFIKYISYKQLMSNYLICSMLTEIKKLQKCITQQILISKQKRNDEIIENSVINLTYKQNFKVEFSNLIQFIISKKVQAYFIKENKEKVKIIQNCDVIGFVKIQIHIEIEIIQ